MPLPTSRSCHIPMLRDVLLLTIAANAIASHSTSVAKMQPSSLARDRRMMPNGLESNAVGDANSSPFIEGMKNSLASGLASAAGKVSGRKSCSFPLPLFPSSLIRDACRHCCIPLTSSRLLSKEAMRSWSYTARSTLFW